MPLISIVVAVSDNNVIGHGNALPWRLPDDLRRFKALTMGKPIVMGRKTFDSIGKALPGRTNIVVSRQPGAQFEGCVAVRSVPEALDAAGGVPEVVVVGGAQIYREILPRADTIHLTRVHTQVPGDAFFPDIVWEDWIESASEYHPADARHAVPFSYLTLNRSYVV